MVCAGTMVGGRSPPWSYPSDLVRLSLALLFRRRLCSRLAAFAHQGANVDWFLIIVIVIVTGIHNIEVRQFFIVFIFVKGALCGVLARHEK
jgi:hypothetical protein